MARVGTPPHSNHRNIHGGDQANSEQSSEGMRVFVASHALLANNGLEQQ